MFWLSAREYVSWTWGRAPSLCVEAKLGPWVLPRGEGRQPARVTHATSGILPHFPQKSGSASKAPSLHSQREVAWLGDTQRVSWVWTHLADCQQTWREGKKGRAGEGRGGGGAVGNGQALSKKCSYMHPAVSNSAWICMHWRNCPTQTVMDATHFYITNHTLNKLLAAKC